MDTPRTRRAFIIAAACTVVLAVVMTLLSVLGAAHSGPHMRYNAVDYRVQVLADGDLRITQTIDYRLDKRDEAWHQLYQQFTLTSDRLTGVSDVSVRNLDTGQTYTQIEPHTPSGRSDAVWDREFADHWYIADVTSSAAFPKPFDMTLDALTPTESGAERQTKDIEIGWNIPSTTSAKSMRFELAMTWHGVSTAYDDVVAFEWEPFGAQNTIPATVVTASVAFPEGIAESNSWAWLHYGGDGMTTRGADGSLTFTVHDLPAREYVNLVVMMERRANSTVARRQSGEMRQRILDQERDEAARAAAAQRRDTSRRIISWVVVGGIAALIALAALLAARSACARRRTQGPEYWREPPNISPAAAAVFIEAGDLDDRQMTSTLLSLVTKGAIAVYPGPARSYRGIDMSRADAARFASRAHDGERMCTLVIMPAVYAARERLGLCRSEGALLDLLLRVSERLSSPVYDFAQMEDALRGWRTGYAWLRGFEDACRAEYRELHASEPVGSAARTLGAFGIAAAMIAAFIYVNVYGQIALMLAIAAPSLFGSLFAMLVAPTTAFTAAGRAYAGQVHGLMRYMEDFSEFADRDVFDVVLWGRYMVYAAAFGISDRLLEQTARAYPQVRDEQWRVYVSSGVSSVRSTIRTEAPKSGGTRRSGGAGPSRGNSFRGHSGGSGGGRGGGR